MRVAVTGASGFVGTAVCRALLLSGHDVAAYGRRAAVASSHPAHGSYHAWDIASGRLPSPPRVEAVVHCAGTVSDWGAARTFHATNLTGTRNVLASFTGARFVHISTASVYDPRVATVMATEESAPVRRYLNAYGASKAAAERAVLAAMVDRPAIVLRPHAVYGPGDTTLLPRVLSAVRGRRLPVPGNGHQLVSLTHVDNLARAAVLAIDAPVDRGVFNVTDARPVVLDGALRWMLAERGVDARPVYLPVALLWPLAWAAEAFTLAGSATAPTLTRYALGHLAVERTLDITAARDHLGYTPTPTCFTGAAAW